MANLKTNAMRMLETANIVYKVHTYNFDGDYDGNLIADKIGIPAMRVFKTLVTVAPSKNYYIFVLPVNAALDLKLAAKSVGEKSVEMIPVKDITKITGYVRGGCSPIGMKKQYMTVFDLTAKDFETIVFSAGKIGYQIEVNAEKVSEITGAKFDNIKR